MKSELDPIVVAKRMVWLAWLASDYHAHATAEHHPEATEDSVWDVVQKEGNIYVADIVMEKRLKLILDVTSAYYYPEEGRDILWCEISQKIQQPTWMKMYDSIGALHRAAVVSLLDT